MGIIQDFRNRREIKGLMLEYDKKSLQMAVDTIEKVESKVVQKEPDEDDWMLLGQGGKRLSEADFQTIWDKSYELWDTNLQARAIIRTMVKFVIGKGAVLKPAEEKDESGKELDQENYLIEWYWEEFKKENAASADGNGGGGRLSFLKKLKRKKWNHREKEIFTRLFRDGEIIIRVFPPRKVGDNNGIPKIRFIRPQRIMTPKSEGDFKAGEKVSYGIGHNPDDVEEYRTYYYCDYEGNLLDAIPAEEILHYKIFADSDQKRGVSLLKVCAPMIKKYEGWLEDRIVLNRIRTAIALVRKVDAKSPSIQKLREDMLSERRDEDRKKTKIMDRGTIITSGRNVDWEMLSPNIHAQDVKDDGRNMLLSISAAIGFPEMILTADYSNSNYSSTLIAQNPFVREIEDWQDFATTIYDDIWALVMLCAMEFGKLPKGTSTKCSVEYPPMIAADIEKETKAYQIQNQSGILSKKTWAARADLDYEGEQAQIEQEQSKDTYNLPPGQTFPGGGGALPEPKPGDDEDGKTGIPSPAGITN